MPITQSVVISAAGLGSRMGLGIPKALIEINGQSLISRALDILDDFFQDIYVVAGYQAPILWQEISQRKRPPIFVLNHKYLDTGTAGSVSTALKYIDTERVLLIDGDILFTRLTIEEVLNCSENTLGIGSVRTDKPVFVEFDKETGNATSLSQSVEYPFEWSGITLLYKAKDLDLGTENLFTGINSVLPCNAITTDWVEIDEPHDLPIAEKWLETREVISAKSKSQV